MNWLRENPFLSGVILVFVVGVGVLGFFISGAATALDESTQAYTAAVQKLHQLQNRVPFPNQANLDKTEELRRQFEAELDALRARLRTMQQPVQENIAPQQFQDELRQRVNALTAKAQAAKVGLPENPGVRSIDALTRPTLPEEGTAPEPKDKPAVRREPFLLTFTAEQGKFRIALNSLLKTDTFLIVRNLMVENSKQDGPPVQAEGAAPADDTQLSSLFGTSNEAPQSGSSLDVILGRELLTIRAMIEMIEFNLPPGAEEQSEAAE